MKAITKLRTGFKINLKKNSLAKLKEIMNIIYGLTSIILGIALLIITNEKRKRNSSNVYGEFTKMYFGAIGFIVLGLIILIKEII